MNRIQNAKNAGNDKGFKDAVDYIPARGEFLAKSRYADRNEAAAFAQGYKEGYKIGEDTNRDNDRAPFGMTVAEYEAFVAEGIAEDNRVMDSYLDALENYVEPDDYFY